MREREGARRERGIEEEEKKPHAEDMNAEFLSIDINRYAIVSNELIIHLSRLHESGENILAAIGPAIE